jgi:tripartite-type tricarboxylate transporter receptor subunit TctC
MFLASSTAASVNPIVIKDLPYDPLKDLRPVSGLTRTLAVIVVPGDSKLHSLADLVAEAKKAKEPLKVGNYSELYHLNLEWFAGLAGIKFLNVPYKGAPQAITDLLGHQIDFTIMDLASAAPLLKSGKIRGLAVSGKDRSADFPDLPTFAESGYPKYVYYGWNGFYVRADTPDEITHKLAEAMQKVMASTAAHDYARKIGAELMPLGPEAMQSFHRNDVETLRRVAEAAGIKPQ